MKTRTLEEVTNSLAQALPQGRLFQAGKIQGTNLRKLLTGLSPEIGRIEGAIANDLYEQYFINEKKDGLLEEWEREVGIPDNIFSITGKTRAERVDQVISKINMDFVITEEDYVALALVFGFTIEIKPGIEGNTFTYTFPFILVDTLKVLRFVIKVFNTGGSDISILKNLFNKIKPANVIILYSDV